MENHDNILNSKEYYQFRSFKIQNVENKMSFSLIFLNNSFLIIFILFQPIFGIYNS